MKPFARSGDFWSGLALAALGAWIVSEARAWTYMGEDGPGAGFFPVWYGAAMIVLSLFLVAGAVLKPKAAQPLRWSDIARAMTCWAAFVACIALMPWTGFVVSFALLTWFIVKVMAGQRNLTGIALGAGFAIGFYALFELGLDLSLPKGVLF
jgi:putative tricarboxylic transport membrane protein